VKAIAEISKKDLDLLQEYNEDYEVSNNVDTEAVWNTITHEIINPALSSLYRVTKQLHKEEQIKDKECPVLQEPLKPSARKFNKCGHYISAEAFFKLQWDGSVKKCPLCRAEHTYHEVD
jgi:hypothetical protein